MNIKTLARVTLYSWPDGRKTPIMTGYRPLFEFPGHNSKTSGRIDIIGKSTFEPGTTQEVEITFLETVLKKDAISPGTRFSFGEGPKPLGEGVILKVFL